MKQKLNFLIIIITIIIFKKRKNSVVHYNFNLLSLRLQLFLKAFLLIENLMYVGIQSLKTLESSEIYI